MKNRLIIAGILIFALAVVAYLDFFWLNFACIALLLGVGVYESLGLYRLNDAKFLIIVALVFFSFTIFIPALHALLAMIALFAGALAFIKSNKPALILPLIYPAAPIFVLFALLNECGMACLIWLVVCVACSDSAAFFVGRSLKANRPELLHPLSTASPNKSREGAIAGVIAGSLFGMFYAGIFVDVEFALALGASVLVSIFGIFGDLFESYLKRLADVKDSGTLLGDHGGVLDRFDAILFGAIAMLVVLA